MKSDLRMSADPEGEWEEEDGRPRRGVGRRGWQTQKGSGKKRRC